MNNELLPADAAARCALRRDMRALRRAIPAATRVAAANGLASQLLALPSAATARRVAGYWAVDGEIALHAWQLGLPPTAVYCLPVLHADQRLRFAPWKPGEPLATNVHGIPEPEVDDGDLLPASAMDLVVVPLVAFDARRSRLGMGGGWYDRSFSFRQGQAAPPMLVGAGFASQGVDDLRPESWAIAMGAICTESRTLMRGNR